MTNQSLENTEPFEQWNMQLTDEEFNQIRTLLYNRFGINLSDQKRALVMGRLRKIILQKGLSSFSDFLRQIEGDPTGRELQTLIDKMSTNHTFFFREPQHFSFLADRILPEITESLIKSGSKDLRIWCAASSTGEEPYSIMMTMMEFFKTSYSQWNAGLLATDISSQVIAIAKSGIYSTDRIQNIPEALKKKYLKFIGNDSWEFIPQVRNEILFRLLNLMNPFPFKKQFHIIFCRNVMIYFDTKTRNQLVNKLYEFTAPGGYLLTGHSESIRAADCPFEYIQPAIFRKGKK